MPNYNYVTSTGIIQPDTATLRDDVNGEFRAVFGADLVLTDDTPQGLLAVAETLARDAVVRNNVAVANQINPDLAEGVFLDALWALTGGARRTASKSVVEGVTVTGTPGAILPAGLLASVGVGGDLFETTGSVLLNPMGLATATFQAVEVGPIAAPIGGLNTVAAGVLGWETVTNPSAAILGQAEESGIAARRRRRDTLASNAVGLPEAITTALFEVPGVRSVAFRENVTAAGIVVEGQALVAHSVYACVAGGTDADVAAALLAHKSLGAGWNGGTTVNVTDPTSGQVYAVKFQRPAVIPIYAEVTVRQGSEVADPVTVVRDALVAYATGALDGEAGLIIGADVSPWELAGAINRQAPGLYVNQVRIGLVAGTYGTAVLTITIAEIAELLAGSISVIIV